MTKKKAKHRTSGKMTLHEYYTRYNGWCPICKGCDHYTELKDLMNFKAVKRERRDG